MKICVRKEKTLQKQWGEGKVWVFPVWGSFLTSCSICAGGGSPGTLCAPWTPVLEQVFTLKDLLTVQRTPAGAGLSWSTAGCGNNTLWIKGKAWGGGNPSQELLGANNSLFCTPLWAAQSGRGGGEAGNGGVMFSLGQALCSHRGGGRE